MSTSVGVTRTGLIVPTKTTKNLSKTHETGFQDSHKMMKNSDYQHIGNK